MSETVSLARLFAAMGPMAETPAPDVGAIAAAADAQGFARGRAEAETTLDPLRAQLAAAVAAVEAAAVVDPDALAPLFTDLVTRIARAVVGGELRQSGDAVERLVAAALAAVEVGDGLTVFVSADDAPNFRHPCCRGDDDEKGVPTFATDPDLAPGQIRVETPRHVVAASLDARLADIVAGLA